MNKLIALLLCVICGLSLHSVVNCQSPSFNTYSNPVIPGDHSDCTLTKIGNDFYTTGSSFNPTPIIYHSTDLIHWEAIAQPVSAEWSIYDDKPQGGCWGGQIVYYNNKYWDFFSRANIMYFVTADKPEGPWSMPTKINDPSQLTYGLGYDNSIFIDDDGKWYLMVKNGQANGAIVELGNDGQATGVVYDLNWLNPSPSFPYSWAEGPVMWKYNGYYYYAFARDVSGGQKVMRSKTITADQAAWTTPVDMFNENDPDKSKALFSGPNHSSAAVMLNDSTSWVLHPVWARANSNEWYGNGRQGLVNQVRYKGDEVVADYPANKYFTAPKLPSSGISWMVPKSDFFTTDKLHPEWSFLGFTQSNSWSLTERPGWLRLRPKSATKPNTVIKTDAEHNYSLITRLEFNPKSASDEAGLRLMNGKENLFVKVYATINSNGHKVVSFSYDKTNYESENTAGNVLWLKMVRVNHSMNGYFSSDGINWIQVGNEINITSIDNYTVDYNGWCGNRQGLYVQGTSADFDLYIYRDAYTPILAECPANYFGTVRNQSSILDSIHNNDWALYAGVEFGNKDYPKTSDSVQFIVSSNTAGGTIEVWLDSINTGMKIATCNISNTGSWTTFKTFSAKTDKVKGRHDVYLKFTGTGRLFQLKWIKFVSANGPKYESSATSTDGSRLEVKLSKPVVIPNSPAGFNVFVNGLSDNITGVLNNPDDSLSVFLNLQTPIKKDDNIKLIYYGGNFVSKENLELFPCYDSLVFNRLPGTAPKITKVITNSGGDSLFISFNENMISPGVAASKFVLVSNNSVELNISSGSLKLGDSSVFALKIPVRIYYEDSLVLKYNGQDIKSADNAALLNISSRYVTNISTGYPLKINSAVLRKAGAKYTSMIVKFDKTPITIEGQKDFFTIKINGKAAVISVQTGAADSIRLLFQPAVVYGDTITLSYKGGLLSSLNNGKLEEVVNFSVVNPAPFVAGIDNSKQNQVDVYPNPITDYITVKSAVPFNELRIYSLLGNEVYSQKFEPTNNFTSSQFKLRSGMYLLEIKGDKSATVSKIMVE